MCRVNQGVSFGKNVEVGPPRAGITFAEKQVLQQKWDEKYLKKLQQKDAELVRLGAQLSKNDVDQSPDTDETNTRTSMRTRRLRSSGRTSRFSTPFQVPKR